MPEKETRDGRPAGRQAGRRTRMTQTAEMNILVLNPGGNSLKAELVRCCQDQGYAFEAAKQLDVSIEGIGKTPQLSRLEGKKAITNEPIKANSYADAAGYFLTWYEGYEGKNLPPLSEIDAVAVRVVHGGQDFTSPTLIDSGVEQKIIDLEKLAPLHNKSSVEVLGPVRRKLPEIPIYAVFDTAFHRTMPGYASTYAIPRELAAKSQIRRYGFHGISHRYLLERYAYLAGKSPDACNVVSMHLESGCSVTAVRQGKSVDNTMGLTPLEGLMMGTRSGDVDPAIVPLLMRQENMSADDVLTVLNKKSGLLGVSEVSLDTRVLMKQYDSNPQVKLAMDMFAYRVRKAVGGYMAALGTVDAVVFGGGIAENTKFLRQFVCDGLRDFGIEIDCEANDRLIDAEGLLSLPGSRIEAWVIPTEEGLQIAHECCQAIMQRKASAQR
jgi:acetate kinase